MTHHTASTSSLVSTCQKLSRVHQKLIRRNAYSPPSSSRTLKVDAHLPPREKRIKKTVKTILFFHELQVRIYGGVILTRTRLGLMPSNPNLVQQHWNNYKVCASLHGALFKVGIEVCRYAYAAVFGTTVGASVSNLFKGRRNEDLSENVKFWRHLTVQYISQVLFSAFHSTDVCPPQSREQKRRICGDRSMFCPRFERS